jgi:predicted metal-dependent hydrolase
MAKREITYGTTIIPFTISYSDRTTLAIAVHPSSKVEVTAPRDASTETILKRVERRASWILKQMRKYARYQFQKRKIEWVSGETLYYLGRQYRLKVMKGDSSVKLAGKFLWVSVEDKNNKKVIEGLVNAWYKKQATTKFNDRIQRQAHLIQTERVKLNQLMVRRLEKRWGSCSNKGNIVLNTDLVKTPVDCIDYVIVHELCHLKHLNHSKKFYYSLEKHYPGWQRTKNKLEKYSSLI